MQIPGTDDVGTQSGAGSTSGFGKGKKAAAPMPYLREVAKKTVMATGSSGFGGGRTEVA
jgi:hypothetical protein